MEFSPLGENALILRVGEQGAPALHKLLAWRAQILARAPLGVEEVVPAYQSLTVYFHPLETSFSALKEALVEIISSEGGDAAPTSVWEDGKRHEIPVCYDPSVGPDLERVAKHCGVSLMEVITLHTSAEYLVSGMGFSPGFGFLSGLPEALTSPRRKVPRTQVPAGAVGIAAQQTGIYPSKTAGGWNLIGQTPWKMVYYDREPPNLLAIGDKVKFYAISLDEFISYEQ